MQRPVIPKAVSERQVRLFLWTTPRAASTALTKCLSHVEDSLIFFELYNLAHTFGPEGAAQKIADAAAGQGTDSFEARASKVAEVTTGFETSLCTYEWVKDQLEGAHSDKRFVFCKDIVYCATNKLEFLPKGYRHVFLIRHPLKVFPSWKGLIHAVIQVPLDAFRLDELPPEMFPTGFGFKELRDMIEHVKTTHDQEVTVIDSDDLLRDPRGILSALFETVGLPFDERILQWEASEAIIGEWIAPRLLLQGNKLEGYYQKAFESSCFTKPRPLPDRSALSPDILHCVDASMPYYEEMYAQRLNPKQETF